MRELGVKVPQPLVPNPVTFIEIFPVGLVVALISAVLLRNPRLLPATAAEGVWWRPEMIERIRDGRCDLVFDLLAEGSAATTCDEEGAPLILWCAYYGDVSAIRHLVAHGAPLETLGANYDLNGAAFHGHWQLCQFLVECGADPNHRLADTGETAPHSALSRANRLATDHVVGVLLSAGADPNVATIAGIETGSFMRDSKTRGETPLHRAAAFGSEVAIRMLLDAGAYLPPSTRMKKVR